MTPMTAPASETSTTLAVRCRQVEKTYILGQTKVPALRGVDLDVRAGEMLMLVGPSGCGKTTLISCIAGVLDRDKGECAVFGEDMQAMSGRKRSAFRGRNIGFVFQAFNLIPALNAAENVSVPLLLNGVSGSAALRRSKEMLERVGLADKVTARPSTLSGGQQQRVAIARSLVHEPRLIVCDEPTSALDGDTGQKVMQLLRDVALADGRALVIVTHDNRVFHFADRIVAMEDGIIAKTVNSHTELY